MVVDRLPSWLRNLSGNHFYEKLHKEGGSIADQPRLLYGYKRTILEGPKMKMDEGHLTIALKRRKFSNATSAPKYLGKRQTRIQKRELLSFPALQERVAAAVLLEFMKNMQTRRCLLRLRPWKIKENCQRLYRTRITLTSNLTFKKTSLNVKTKKNKIGRESKESRVNQ